MMPTVVRLETPSKVIRLHLGALSHAVEDKEKGIVTVKMRDGKEFLLSVDEARPLLTRLDFVDTMTQRQIEALQVEDCF